MIIKGKPGTGELYSSTEYNNVVVLVDESILIFRKRFPELTYTTETLMWEDKSFRITVFSTLDNGLRVCYTKTFNTDVKVDEFYLYNTITGQYQNIKYPKQTEKYINKCTHNK